MDNETMCAAVEALQFVRSAYYKNMANDPDGCVQELARLDKQIEDMSIWMRELQTQKFVIEKLVDELNAQLEENGDYVVLFEEEVEEINQGIRVLGLTAVLGEVSASLANLGAEFFEEVHEDEYDVELDC